MRALAAGITLALLALAATSHADDVSATMAALADEKGECRYLLQLCEEYVRAQRIQEEKKVAAESSVERAREANSGAFQFGSAGKEGLTGGSDPREHEPLPEGTCRGPG